MSEKLVVDATAKTARTAERGVEAFVKKAWSIMDAAAEKNKPSEYLRPEAIRSIQGKA